MSEHAAVVPLDDRRLTPATRIAILLIVAIVGLFYVKWMPYYHKAFLALANHSIGKSMLMGTAALFTQLNSHRAGAPQTATRHPVSRKGWSSELGRRIDGGARHCKY